MKVGYCSVNRAIGFSPGHTFDITTYSEDAMIWATAENLSCLARILEFNRKAGLYLFVLDTALVPYAAHPRNTLNWAEEFSEDFAALGTFARNMGIRIAVQPGVPFAGPGSYPGYYTYAATVLDAMGLGEDARILARPGDPATFYEQFDAAPANIRERLVVMNDDVWSVERCCEIADRCGVPVVYDYRPDENERDVADLLDACAATWKKDDGTPMVRFARSGPAAAGQEPTIDPDRFISFLTLSSPRDIDILVDFPDREQSALIAMIAAFEDPRLQPKRGTHNSPD